MPLGLEKFLAGPPVRPELMPTLASLMNQSEDMPGPIQELVAEMGRRLMAARDEEEKTGAELKSAAATPTPQVSGFAESLMRSMGRAVGGLRGDNSGPELAKQLIDRENQDLLVRQKNNLAALADAHERAAKRASDLGDLDGELKSKLAIQSALDKQKSINDLLMLSHKADIEKELQTSQLEAQRAQAVELEGMRAASALNLEGMRQQGDERTALINQGLDPDDPEKPLIGSKSQRVVLAKAKGFLDTNQWTLAMARITDQVRKTKRGGSFSYDEKRMRARLLNELPPDMSYFDNPGGWLQQLMDMKNPNDQTKFLFQRDSHGVILPGARAQLFEYVKRYWPDWDPSIAAIDSVGAR